MIKIKPILEAIHIQRPEPRDKENKGFETIPTDSDPETGKQSWDVIYTGDSKRNKRIMFNKTYQTIKKLADTFEEVAQYSTYIKDGKMQEFAQILRKLDQDFLEYIHEKGKGL